MAENQTRAQVILEANTAAFMAQIRSVATQAQGIFNRVFSALRLPALLSVGGLIAGSVALPTTGRTIGEAVQMQRLHSQLDRLQATLVAELAPIRMLVLRILIALLSGLNATARFFSQLIEKFPEIGNFVKGLITIVVIYYAINHLFFLFNLFGNLLNKAVIAISRFIFGLLNIKKALEFLRKHGFNPFEIFSIALSTLFTFLWQKFREWTKALSTFFGRFITLRVFDKALKGLDKAFDKLMDWANYIDTRFLLGRMSGFTYFLLRPLIQLGKVITTGSALILTVLDFLASAIVTGAIALAGVISSFIGALVATFGVWGTIGLVVAVIMGVISAIYLIWVGFDYIVAALKWFGSALWAAAVWLVKMLYFTGAVLFMIFGFIGKRFLGVLSSIRFLNILSFISQIFYNIFAFIGKILYSVFAFIGKILLNVFVFIGKLLLKGLWWVIKNFIIAPIAALGKWMWDTVSSLFNNISDWFSSLFEQPPFTIQGMSSFGGFTKEELELAAPKMPELVTIGTTAINLLDQIRKLIEQQRSAAIKRVSGI